MRNTRTKGHCNKSKNRAQELKIIHAEPSVIRFTDFVPGECYEQIVVLTNVSSRSQRIRVSQPVSKYFKVERHNSEANQTSPLAIAPGMHWKYRVAFEPDSLSDVRETLLIQTADGDMGLEIVAEREAPILSLPQIMECGYTLQESKLTRFTCENRGGPARFRFCIPENGKLS